MRYYIQFPEQWPAHIECGRVIGSCQNHPLDPSFDATQETAASYWRCHRAYLNVNVKVFVATLLKIVHALLLRPSASTRVFSQRWEFSLPRFVVCCCGLGTVVISSHTLVGNHSRVGWEESFQFRFVAFFPLEVAWHFFIQVSISRMRPRNHISANTHALAHHGHVDEGEVQCPHLARQTFVLTNLIEVNCRRVKQQFHPETLSHMKARNWCAKEKKRKTRNKKDKNKKGGNISQSTKNDTNNPN